MMTHLDLQQQLKDYLISLDLKPNDKIEGEIFLAKKFNVSRYYMRQALNALVQANILARTPKKGTIFRGFDVNLLSDQIRFHFEISQFNIAEFKEARILIERAILPLTLKRITPTQIAKIEKTIENMIAYKHKPEKADKFDRDFHLLLFKSCGNDVLSAFSGVLSSLFHRSDYRNVYWNEAKIEKLAAEHTEVLDAIKKGNARQALAALDKHLGYEKINL